MGVLLCLTGLHRLLHRLNSGIEMAETRINKGIPHAEQVTQVYIKSFLLYIRYYILF